MTRATDRGAWSNAARFPARRPARPNCWRSSTGAVEMGQQSQQDKRMGQMSMFGAPRGQEQFTRGGHRCPNFDEFPSAELLKFEKEFAGFLRHQSSADGARGGDRKAIRPPPRARPRPCAEGAEVTIGGMISRIKKTVTKTGRSAGPADVHRHARRPRRPDRGTIFAESLAETTKSIPGRSGRTDRFRPREGGQTAETPDILVPTK